ncbi:hypothetical protein DB88DRAFT_341127 [Papiliotrema laurentii]|uniref:Uncharacterized protein n=1 Tax=Papiliotrema laurentii TaxID=5418 RepID=A0AAD9D1Q1_PAPLA|nr:hypothetical protein DB88DRAFT_341127 [Papiliotrema laurentii]
MSCRASSSTLSAIRSHAGHARSFHTTSPANEAPVYNPWRYLKRHLKPAPTVPNPLPRIYPQRVVLSDGSTFTSYSTAPTPSILRLTRDVTNNPLWAPGTEKRGVTDEEGRVGRFRRKFEAMDFMASEPAEGNAEGPEGEVVEDLSWMSEGGREETAPPPKVFKKAVGKGGKKK